MLVLTRKFNEVIHIGDNVTVRVLRIRDNAVKLGIDAPRDIEILREELKESEVSDEHS